MAGSQIPSYVLYGEPSGSAFPDCLHCERVSERSRLHNWTIQPHRHRGLHQFFWIAKGSVVVTSDTYRRALKAPALIMNAPMSVHGFEWEAESDGYVITVPTVSLDNNLPPHTGLLGRLDRSLFLQYSTERTAAVMALKLFEAIDDEYRGRQEGRVQALLCQVGLLALFVIRAAGRRQKSLSEPAHSGVAMGRRFVELVESNYRKHRPLSFYAFRLGVSVTHLGRICRGQFGISSQSILHDRLILEAKRNLAYTSASVADIASDLGFRDAAYFSKFFASQVGDTPSSFRKTF
ncbi:helix-turn-helix domain-containing protein [Bradyrhizobium jicamae]|uniref:Helix-turn-helix domain-containing protein n=1 Tax=Bradyrhizobium jicamae TaxID=280332 RepID=A0ABS5FWM1_9BRAD|nr:helix-turn-helix domain-containing protein [Bradyrhizobium jicamae]MBR0801209.1 helix-turn-helix domain-containing protein [Bradyrhizobium jicamae]MBR0938488.1 helix-turn-helix domain-containing protein [Bradyrhizobium jicamae]